MARLFIAIRFSDQFKQKLVALQDTLKERGVQGNYCPYGNLHMTLVFIGERYDLTAVQEAVREVSFDPFDLTLGRLGSFPTRSGVIWCGIKETCKIVSFTDLLKERLTAHGIMYRNIAFFPHISLVQQPSSIITDIEVPEATTHIERIYIMKSERINDELVYSEV